MRSVLKVLALTFLFVFVAPVAASLAGECPAGQVSERAFFSRIPADAQKVYTLTPSGQAKFMAAYGAMSKQTMPADAKLYFAPLGPRGVGVVVMSQGCVFPRSVEVVPSGAFALIFQQYKIAADEIVEYALRDPA